MSHYSQFFKQNLLRTRSGLGISFLGFADGFGSLFNRSRYERADTFSDVFGRFRDEVMCGEIQVAGNAVWKPLLRPPASAAVALPRHEDIVPVHSWPYRILETAHHDSTGQNGLATYDEVRNDPGEFVAKRERQFRNEPAIFVIHGAHGRKQLLQS